ncbi:MAG: hypothetical protein ACE37I_16380 [Rubinisphaera brasiliensis]|uniref:hypothetical protein n=1 Tax=Rubinisphaera brasiliensis TaxID=119 RepID=UPI00391C2A2A|nr:hypothetical protein [bacterium]
MSGFGISNLPALSLPSSVAGGQQARPGQDAARNEAAGQDFRSTLKALSAKTSGDVADPELSADRDADGRYLPGFTEEHPDHDQQTSSDSSSASGEAHRSRDVDGQIGRFLDLDA